MLQVTPKGQDLRSWIDQMESAGELMRIEGAEREEEIGGIVDIYQRKMGRPAILFVSVKRIALTLGLPENTSEIELVRFWRNYFKHAPTVEPTPVNTGAALENVFTGADIDLLKIPTPRWHEGDGGYYMGTACMVIMKDPDSGWINYGAYRVQVHDRALATVMASKGKHGDIIMRKYHDKGEPCPIAVVVGVHPGLFAVAGVEVPYGKNEYDAA